jgi:transposase
MPVPLREDFAAPALRAAAWRSKNAAQARRLLARAAVYDGASRTDAARIGGVTLQIVRDWVLRFNSHGPGGLVDRKAPGQPAAADRRAPRRAGRRDRERAGPRGAWRGGLVADRPLPVAMGGVPADLLP